MSSHFKPPNGLLQNRALIIVDVKVNYLKFHLFRLGAKLFVVVAAAELAGNGRKIELVTIINKNEN
jgi:hypothetical protein